jgi:riboflavin synthase
MFTGIVSHRGRVRRAKMRKGVLELEVEAPVIAKALDRGDSVAVDGVCLTAVSTSRRYFVVQAVTETLERSAMGSLDAGEEVNLELPLRLSDRLGGHLVQGHVDGTATVIRLEDDDDNRRMWLAATADVLRYLVPKGSVTVNGVALTVTEAGVTSFGVAVVPHTRDVTTLGSVAVGATVNVEVDMIAKYVERLVPPYGRGQ